MSLAPRSISKAAASCSNASKRASSSTSKKSLPPLRAALILSRQPLLTRSLHPLEDAYYKHNRNLRHAISNPLSETFYFKEGSLPHRRFRQSEWEYTKEIYGSVIAGPQPDLGEISPEREHQVMDRNHWVEEDKERGERSLERKPEQEVFCLVQSKKEGQWSLPTVELQSGEGLDEALENRITGKEGWFDGKSMNTWLVTKKPIGLVKKGDQRTYYLKSHILGGEPTMSEDAPWKTHAWLTKTELRERLSKQGQEQWEDIRKIFGSRQ